jgi:hypothetical protein
VHSPTERFRRLAAGWPTILPFGPTARLLVRGVEFPSGALQARGEFSELVGGADRDRTLRPHPVRVQVVCTAQAAGCVGCMVRGLQGAVFSHLDDVVAKWVADQLLECGLLGPWSAIGYGTS